MMYRPTHQDVIWSIAAIAAILLIGLVSRAWAGEWIATPARTIVCTEQYLPVCGQRGDVVKTYSNACFARADGATVIARGPCNGQKPYRPMK